MANMLQQPAVSAHAAVRVANCILVFGGVGKNLLPIALHDIWMYNMCTEKWRKCAIKGGKCFDVGNCCVVAIEENVYIFGGDIYCSTSSRRVDTFTNDVWKLTRATNQCFEWNKTKSQCKKKTPSPRKWHGGWQYTGQLWTFGGFGLRLSDYLHDHGDFEGRYSLGVNNQLLCFSPLSEEWRNPETSGTVPKPCSAHATTIIRDKVWMFGGSCDSFTRGLNDLYQLDMVSLTWTEIQFLKLKPPCRVLCSLNAFTEHQLVLHGGESTIDHEVYNDTWIFDLLSMTWKKYTVSRGQPRAEHTGTEGLNGCVVIVGGHTYCKNDCCTKNTHSRHVHDYVDSVITLRIEPKNLKQLAIQKICQHEDILHWKLLPNSLKALFRFPQMGPDAEDKV